MKFGWYNRNFSHMQAPLFIPSCIALKHAKEWRYLATKILKKEMGATYLLLLTEP